MAKLLGVAVFVVIYSIIIACKVNYDWFIDFNWVDCFMEVTVTVSIEIVKVVATIDKELVPV